MILFIASGKGAEILRKVAEISRKVFCPFPNDPIPRGPSDRKNSIPIESFNPGLKFSISVENSNLDRKFQSCDVSIYGALLVLQRRARSEISIHDQSLEIFNPEAAIKFFQSLGPLGK